MEARSLGWILIGAGMSLVVLGLVVYWGGFSWFGRLPGDIRYEGENIRVYVPLTSMVLISVLLTVVVNVVRRLI